MTDWIDKERERRQGGETRALLQSQHGEVNARYPGCTLEYCQECDQPTGKAGRDEDSLYCDECWEHDGPFCEQCHTVHINRHWTCEYCGRDCRNAWGTAASACCRAHAAQSDD